MKPIACCHIPNQVMLVDDDEIFLKSVSLKLRRQRAVHQYVSSLDAAIELEKIASAESLFSQVAQYAEEEDREKRDINFDVRELLNLIYSADRFKTLGILVTDYTMPGLHGIDLAKKAPAHCKRVLLTGDADEKTAVEAFNQGAIHRFIKKDSSNIMARVETAIAELEQEFFHEMNDDIITHFKKQQDDVLQCFDDLGFHVFAKKIFEHYKIVEHYILDSRGSLLALDSQGNYMVIAVCNADDMRTAIDMVEMSDAVVPDKIKQAVTSKQKLLYTSSEENYNLEPTKWNDYLFDVDYKDGANTFYAAVINDPPLKLDKDRIVSFDDYLDSFYSVKS